MGAPERYAHGPPFVGIVGALGANFQMLFPECFLVSDQTLLQKLADNFGTHMHMRFTLLNKSAQDQPQKYREGKKNAKLLQA